MGIDGQLVKGHAGGLEDGVADGRAGLQVGGSPSDLVPKALVGS